MSVIVQCVMAATEVDVLCLVLLGRCSVETGLGTVSVSLPCGCYFISFPVLSIYLLSVTSYEVGCKYFEFARVEVSLLGCVYFFNR